MLEKLADDALEPLHHHGRWPTFLPRRVLHWEVGRPRHHQIIPDRPNPTPLSSPVRPRAPCDGGGHGANAPPVPEERQGSGSGVGFGVRAEERGGQRGGRGGGGGRHGWGRSSSGVLGGGGFGLVVPRLIRDREACETVREETMGGIAREGGLETWASAFLTRKAYYEIFTRRGRIRVWKGMRPLKHCNSTL